MARKRFTKKQRKNLLTGILCGAIGLFALGGVAALSDGFENMNVGTWVQQQVFEDIDDYELEFTSANSTASLTDGFMYVDDELFENSKVTKIGLPVASLNDCTKDSVFTISVVNYEEAMGTTACEVIDEIELEIEADTYNRNEINEWVYFYVDIELDKGETLVFGSADDTITLAYDSEGSNKDYNFYTNALGTATPTKADGSLIIDVFKIAKK